MADEMAEILVFGKDLKCKIEKVPFNKDGSRLNITVGGTADFRPEVKRTGALKIPNQFPWNFINGKYRELYFVRKWASEVVDFDTGEVPNVDVDQVMNAARNKILESKGKRSTDTNLFMVLIAILSALNFIILLKVVGVIV